MKNKVRYRFMLVTCLFFVLAYNLSTYFFTFSEYVSKISTTETGVIDNIVTINDLEDDYNYYVGLNYTSSDGTLPTMENKNIYNESNLVETKINYYGYDINKENYGYVSLNEKQDTYIYYKIYPVNDAGTTSLTDDYLEIELIDNPFTDRPNNMAFNGWITDYSNVSISYHNDYYIRKAKIPVTYENNIPKPIEINFYSNWKEAKTGIINSNTNWEAAFGNLDEKGMQPIGGEIPIYESLSGLYFRNTASFASSYPSGAVDSRGESLSGRCMSFFSTCTYYVSVDENSVYDSTLTYYKLNGNGNNRTMTEYEVSIVGYEEIPKLVADTILAGYYKKVNLNDKNIAGYYDEQGNIQTSGICTSNCTYYELINYYDKNGNVNKADGKTIYYYLATRDTNIIVMNGDISTKWSDNLNKPFTLTSIHNDVDYTNSTTWNVSNQYVTCYADTTIENIKINSNSSNSTSNPASNSTTTRNIYANYNNLKIGRGIIQSGNSKTFNGVFGGNNNTSALGSRTNVTKYRLVVESGFYNTITLTNGPSNTNRDKYIEAKGVYGNDYDRAIIKNDKLDVYFEAAGSWGAGNYYSSTNTGITFDATIKSGSYGTSKYDHTTGVYVGGRSYGTHYTSRKIKVEGGWIYNLIGGPLTADDREDINDTYIYVTGGTIDMIIGGAGTSTTYGNRIVSVTGGVVNYSVFGGSNSYSGTASDGKLLGNSFVYIGGDATIGNNDYISSNDTLWGAESGSVFGIGNGNDNSSTIGSNKNSNIIIDKNARVLGNVYGGGNYSATGASSSSYTTTTNIKLLGGTIYGSIYGGGNKNGSGTSNITSVINVDIFDGIVKNNIYGGSRENGTIYGDINLNLLGGIIEGSVFGGGQGSSTYVSSNINISSGNNDLDIEPTINSIYGGSEYGTVNGIGTIKTDNKTILTINKGEITSIYGGAKGDGSVTPYVLGDVIVNINGGLVDSVYGGNENSGTLSKISTINLNNGKINNVYGGGYKTSLNTSNIYLKGSTVTNIYGGSNESGNVDASNIIVESGIATTIYGGNNVGGITDSSNIIINDGEITNIYGGGKLTDTSITNISVNGATIDTIYGGGEESSVDISNIEINSGNITNIFGGSNIEGTVTESNVTICDGEIQKIYGGNNIGGITDSSNVIINGGKIINIYGGGNDTETTTSNVFINDGFITNLHGGGNNKKGITEDVNIELNSGIITNIYGGGNAADTINTNINLKGSVVTNIYGGGNESGIDTTTINLIGGHADNIYGGSNKSGDVNTSMITTSDSSITSDLSMSFEYSIEEVNPYWQDANYSSVAAIKVTLLNNSSETLEKFNGYIKINDSTLYSNYSSTKLIENDSTYNFSEVNIYDSQKPNSIKPNEAYTFEFSVYSKMNVEDFKITDYQISGYSESGNKLVSNITELKISNIFGGNNEGGITNKSDIILFKGEYGNIYGGGNKAEINIPNIELENVVVTSNIYGGGNDSLVSTNTNIYIKNSQISGSIFGGGNAGIVTGNTNLYVTSSDITGSIYGGGNGSTAIVIGDTKVLIDDNTIVRKHIFGGGNAANTGTEEKNSTSDVYITGANVIGNVYGGGNTSILYGNSNVNIGIDNYDDDTIKSDIIINGSVFGGGEANEAGSENYDFSHIGVTNGTIVNINANNHEKFSIDGSIFGSGNASSTNGESYINILNYGTEENYKTNISIQRADLVTIDNSNIELIGATDRTNEYSTVLFTLSRVKHLKLKNNSILYLNNGANLLEEYTSAVDIDGEEVISEVLINEEEITKNVDNRIYMLQGKNLNIATNENATAYGKVNGMTFFGMYIKDRNNLNITGYYDKTYNDGELIDSNDLYLFDSGSYVLGYHKANHDISKDGFYSNFSIEEVLNIKYIEPTPDDSTYYMWSIGEQVITMELSLTASKYITLGAEELNMLNYSDPNTQFSIVGFNYNDLDPNVKLVDESEVPRIADNTNDADNIMSLVMKSTNSGWITDGETTFLTSEDNIKGTTLYKSENTSDVPSFQFYLYHSKNLGTTGDMGSVTISFVVIKPIDDISNEIERVNLVVNLDRALYNTNDYEGAMTTGKEYGMFASTNVNLTTDGSLSAYYSLYTSGNESIYKEGYHRALVSTYVFPENTKLTLINLNEKSVNEYYHYTINKGDYEESLKEYKKYGECSYQFSKFIKMGSIDSNNNFDDAINNKKYYDENNGVSFEEFIVIVDFAESNISQNVLNKSLLLELRNASEETIVSVLGIEQERMIYNLYANSNAVVDVEGNISSNKIYPGDTVTLNIKTNFNRKTINSETIYDTNYFDQQLGVKISFIDSNGNHVTGASLLGVTYEYEGKIYYPRMDGSVRINLAETMANVSSKILIKTTDSVAAGDYTMIIESFGSADGIYYGEVSSDTETLDVNVLDTVYGLSMSMGDHIVIIDKENGTNLNENKSLRFNLKYNSSLENPHLRISLYRRKYENVYSLDYELVDLSEFLEHDLATAKNKYEYLLESDPLSDINYDFNFKENLKSGTYKLVVSLYDKTTYIGDVYKYIIVKEKYNE